MKASNILVDGNLVAKVSDFGLAKAENLATTEIKGTFGYINPHYLQSGKPSRQSDAYAFGVVLLEVPTGNSMIRARPGGQFLLIWVQNKVHSREFEHLVAPCLKGGISKASLKLYVETSQKCVHADPSERMWKSSHNFK